MSQSEANENLPDESTPGPNGDDDNNNNNNNDSRDDGDDGDNGDALSEEAYRQTVSQLVRVSAPPTFKHDVEETLRQRSGGRFFGRKAFGDRIPYEILAIVVLLIGLAAYFVLRTSATGSLRYEKQQEAPKMAPSGEDVVPVPSNP